MAPPDAEAPPRPMKRELSVEDLFAPLNRLDVRRPSASADAEPTRTPGAAEPPPSDFSGFRPASFDNDRVSSACSTFSLDMASIPEEIGLVGQTEKSPRTGATLAVDCNSDDSISVALAYPSSEEHLRNSKGHFSMSKANACSTNEATALQTQGNSTSDEDQQVLDDRKQRRMLSNRESARRSRLRKQQHLDELRGHVAHLRAQNSQMLSSFNSASQQFAQIMEENRKLRSEAIYLCHQLQMLHHTVTSQRANNGLVQEETLGK